MFFGKFHPRAKCLSRDLKVYDFELRVALHRRFSRFFNCFFIEVNKVSNSNVCLSTSVRLNRALLNCLSGNLITTIHKPTNSLSCLTLNLTRNTTRVLRYSCKHKMGQDIQMQFTKELNFLPVLPFLLNFYSIYYIMCKHVFTVLYFVFENPLHCFLFGQK